MRLTLEKASGKSKCRHSHCRKVPTYIDDAEGHIKQDTTTLVVELSTSDGIHRAYYCRDCIDIVFHDKTGFLKREKASGKSKCRRPDCRKLSAHTDGEGRIRRNTDCTTVQVETSAGTQVAHYCADCFTDLDQQFRKFFNADLWAFH